MEETRRRTLHGRRRGKKLRVGQQSLLDTLLPRLALALPAEPHKIDLAKAVRRPLAARWRVAGDRLRRGRASGLAGRAASRCRPDRLRALPQRRRQVPGAYRAHGRRATSGCSPTMPAWSWRRCPTARSAASSCCFPTPGPRRGITSAASCSARPWTGWPSSWSRVRSCRLATDDPSYLPWMVEHACTHPAFEWLAEGPADWRGRPADWPATRYEKKQLAGTPTFLRFRRRVDRPARPEQHQDCRGDRLQHQANHQRAAIVARQVVQHAQDLRTYRRDQLIDRNVEAHGAGEVAARKLLLHDQAGQGDQVADAEAEQDAADIETRDRRRRTARSSTRPARTARRLTRRGDRPCRSPGRSPAGRSGPRPT